MLGIGKKKVQVRQLHFHLSGKNVHKYLVFLIVFIMFLCSSLSAQTALGQSNRLSYELGINALRIGDVSMAKKHFQQALSGRDSNYADQARLELVRLMANTRVAINKASKIEGGDQGDGNIQGGKEAKQENSLERIRQMLASFRTQEIIPAAWITAVNGLERSGHQQEALELAQELYLSFPEKGDYAVEALFICARLLYYEYFLTDPALEHLYTILSAYPQSRATLRSYQLLAKIYLNPKTTSPNLGRACHFLKLYRKQGGSSLNWQQHDQKLDKLCGI